MGEVKDMREVFASLEVKARCLQLLKALQLAMILWLAIPSMNFTFQKIMLHKHYVRAA